MSKFILIDQSLSDPGGHHFECSQLLLEAAERRGWRTYTAANLQFKPQSDWPDRWPVVPVFRDSAYVRHSSITGVAAKPFDPFSSWRDDLSSDAPWWSRERWEDSVRRIALRARLRRRIRRDVARLQAFWTQVEPQRGDVAYLQTVSEYDLNWLRRFLRDTPGTEEVEWHLHFHNDYLRGRDPSHDRQLERLDDMRRHFGRMLGDLRHHRLHLHATTEALRRQFALLDVVPVDVLECAVNPSFVAAAKRNAAAASMASTIAGDGKPLRVVCGGYGRDEKGWRSLVNILASVWRELFESGRCQLQIQASAPRVERPQKKRRSKSLRVQPELVDTSRAAVEELERAFAARLAIDSSSPPATTSGEKRREGIEPIQCLPHPMLPDDYRRFLTGASIGLFPYDPNRYFARYSAVLAEMLCAGVPVIVPAATWLADQIAAANQRHVAEVLRTSAVLGSATPTNGEAWPLPASATDVAIECRGDRAPVGAYARLSVVQFDPAGHDRDRCTLVDRPLEGAEGWASLVHIVSRATSLAVQLSDLDFVASQDSQPATGHLAGSSGVALDRRWSLVSIHALGASSEWTSGRPLGAVGLSAADEREFGRQLREICRFHPHYLATARRFAVDYAQRHSADMIFGTLIQSRPASPIAVRAA